MKSETISTGFFASTKTLNRSCVPFPIIYKPIRNQIMSTPKIKDKILTLKKELNKRIFEFNELKIAMAKLESQKEQNKRILNKAIIESKTTENPITLSHNTSSVLLSKEMTISTESFSKLKEANIIAFLKHQVSLTQKQIKQKEDEIEELRSDSKYAKLIEKNKQLLDVFNQTTTILNQIEQLRIIATDKEAKANEAIMKSNKYKSKLSSIKNNIDLLKDKYKNSLIENEARNQKIAVYVEKANNLKFQYNTLKQNERELENEIRFYEEQFSSEGRLLEEKDNNNEEYKRYMKDIQALKEEIKQKDNEIKTLEKENTDCLSIIEREESNQKKKRIADSNQIEGIKKEMIHLKREMQIVIEDNEALETEINALSVKLNNKAVNHFIKESNICKEGEYTFIQIPKIKIETKPKPKLMTLFTKKKEANKLNSSPNINQLRLSIVNDKKSISIQVTAPNADNKRMDYDVGLLILQKTISNKEEDIKDDS